MRHRPITSPTASFALSISMPCRWPAGGAPPLIFGLRATERGQGYSLVDTIFQRHRRMAFWHLPHAATSAMPPSTSRSSISTRAPRSLLRQLDAGAALAPPRAREHDLATPDVLTPPVRGDREWRAGAVRESHRRAAPISSISVAAIGDSAVRDIDRRHRPEAARAIVPAAVREQSDADVGVRRRSFEFLSVNDAAVAHYGYSREQFLRMTIGDIWPRDERDGSLPGVAGAERQLPVAAQLAAYS